MDHFFIAIGCLGIVRFVLVKIKFEKLVKIYWMFVVGQLERAFEDPIDTLKDMKAKLEAKYLPSTFCDRLMD